MSICLRHCSVCEGMDHHWLPDSTEDHPEPFMKCKHCPATRDYFDEDDLEDDDDYDEGMESEEVTT